MCPVIVQAVIRSDSSSSFAALVVAPGSHQRLNRLQRLIQVGNDVLDIFNAD
jgi:hypothetical protein